MFRNLIFRSHHFRFQLPVALCAVGLVSVINTTLTNRHSNQQSLISSCDSLTNNKDSDSNAKKYLSVNFVADAADLASPAVVNIVSKVNAFSAKAGSGFILSKDGFIVTNAHVVGGAVDGKVLVTTWDGLKIEGRIHSIDTASDLALVKIPVDAFRNGGVPVAKIGTSDTVRVGEFVVALGSPLRLSNTVTFGIVSSIARQATELGMSQNRNEYIQTDASINQGNSGGPLVNLKGEVIGVNTMKVLQGDGISFAIPIDTVMAVVNQLKKQKRVVRPYIGLRLGDYGYTEGTTTTSIWPFSSSSTTTPQQQSLNKEVVVLHVEPNSPAQAAGLQEGDVIVAVYGKKTKGVKSVLNALGQEAGHVLQLRVKRKQQQQQQGGEGEGEEFDVEIVSKPWPGEKH